ncbi:hypothetical protein [Pinibacter soli]|uniref:Outer membrane protein beta-barrel domain-containing protein n=1 Tax=Pinibacter soli TaxID=3044211 RepID=A0ABT6R9F0_9BACT|nr:hypothetical protein [Pinibacter soli]MDI3318512.1 hypothetical protein [Pinibacter soli]
MDKDFYTDEFEQFLKSKADQHRLYPSEMVWKKINRTLHPTKSGLIVAALFLLFLLTGDQILRLQAGIDKNELSGSIIKNDEIAATDFLQQIRAGLNLTQNKSTVHIFNQPIYSNSINIYKWLNSYDYVANSSLPKVIADKLPIAQRITSAFSTRFSDLPPLNAIAASYVAIPENEVGKVVINNNYTDVATSMNPTSIKAIRNNNSVTPAVAAKPIINIEPQKSSVAIISTPASYASVKIPIAAEKKHLQLQYYFAPTISFRKLEDPSSKSTSSQDLPLASNHLDVNKFVNHSPTIGLEAGSAMLFPITKNISLKAGLQLNMNGYNVSAYTYSREKATIALNTPGNNDTIRAFTSIRNMNGYSQEILQNRYFQVSVPVGVDVKIIGDHRLQLNAAGTFQPFYIMAHSTYLLSNDYNNYVKEHSLVRRFNYAANLETYISYTGANGLKFQMGPQFRYQLKSTYSDKYPIHEYLMEYSIKFGIIKTLK